MKKIVDDARLIYKCCYLYYMDGLGQKEIWVSHGQLFHGC